MNKTKQIKELKDERSFFIVLTIFLMVALLVVWVTLPKIAEEVYNQGVNDTLQSLKEDGFIDGFEEMGSFDFIIPNLEPKFEGIICNGNYTVFINKTHLGCILK